MTAGTFTVEELIDEGVLAPPMDGNHGSIHPKTVDYVETGIPFVMASDLIGGRVDTINCAFLSDDQANSLRKGFSKTGDVLLSHKATIGRTAIVGPLETDFIMLTPQITYYRVLDEDRLDRRYLYYYFNSRPFQELLGQWAGAGSTRAYLGITGQRKLPIVVPEPSVQKDIVWRLGALDDKIELNRRMNETLEEMARALFRDWFVDFGPTRRQMEGATDPAAIMGHAFPPEKAATLAPLFPATLGDDGLPVGWEEQPFEAFVEIVGGGTPKTKIAEYWGGDIPWFSVVDAPTQGAIYVHSTEKSITQAGLENSSARMVPEGTTIISARGTVGKIGMAPRDMTFNQSCYALRPKKPVGERFVILATGQLVERLQAMAHGSVFSTITRNTFSSLSFAGGDELCYSAFEDVTAPLFAKIKANGQENQTLAEMRDLLLPKLMSGEIRLKDAEVVVE